MDATLLSLIGFAIVMYITPGPNNVMVTSSAAHHGVRATVPHMAGITIGFAFMLMVMAAGLGGVFLSWPPLLTSRLRVRWDACW